MPRYQYIQNSFSAGEISPKVFPRTDTAEYKNGLKEAVNFIPGDTGGMFRRTGIIGPYNLQLGSSNTGPAQILSATMNSVDYTFICQPEGIRYISYANSSLFIGGVVTDTLSAEENYKAAYAENPTGFSLVSIGTFSIMTHISGNYEPWIINSNLGILAMGTWEEVFTSSLGISGTYPEIYSHYRYPYTDFGNNGTSLTPSASTVGAITITASQDFFSEDDVGSYFIIEDPTTSDSSSKFVLVKITEYTSPTQVDAYVYVSSGAYTPTASFSWCRNMWSKALGYPKTVGYIDNRIVFGNTRSYPTTIWGSEQGFIFWFNGYFEYIRQTASGTFSYYYGSYGYIYINSVTVYYPSTGTYEYALSSDYGGEIKWITDFSGMIVGTGRKIHLVTDSSGATGPSNRSVKSTTISSIPCSSIFPAQSPTSMFVLDSAGSRVFVLERSEQDRGYSVVEVTAINPQIKDEEPYVQGAFVSMVWDELGNTLILTTSNGGMRYFKYKKESGVMAWTRAKIDGFVYSVGFLPQADLTVITGKTSAEKGEVTYSAFIRYEGLEEDTVTSLSSAHYLDLAGFATLDESGDFSVGSNALPIYAGQTVTVVDEEGVVSQLEINSNGEGSLGIEKANQEIVFGFPYESRFTLLTPEVGPNQLLSSQGDVIRIDRATAYLYKSWAGEYSGDGENFYPMEIAEQSNTMKYQFDVNASPDIESNITIKTSAPLPLNVTGIVLRGTNNP